MELGEKLLQARQEAGLSQRQLCGDVITRNMLSQIEHGTARPSMDTLRYLSARLGKPIGYFLDEEGTASPNQQTILAVRQAFRSGDSAKARLLLENYRGPDAVFDGEYRYWRAVTALAAAETAMEQEKHLYARQLLEDAAQWDELLPEVRRKRLLIQSRLPDADLPFLASQLPSLDQELYLRSRAALAEHQPRRAVRLLNAAEDRSSLWQLCMGRALTAAGEYSAAVNCLAAAERDYGPETAPLLETCFRELGDYQKAYFYACKQREK